MLLWGAVSAGLILMGHAAQDPLASICGTYPGRVLTELAQHRYFLNRRAKQGYATQSLISSVPVDEGNIAIVPDDGTMVFPANTFDLDEKNIVFAPAAARFSVTTASGGFDSDVGSGGVVLNPSPGASSSLGDDDSREVVLGFAFPYFGKTYTSVFINSDGNLTFVRGDAASTERSLARFLAGPPRIAPYFADLDPSVGGRVSYFASPARFVVTWNQVPDFASSGSGPLETFQVALTPDGRIQVAYNGIRGQTAVVGISPGSFVGSPNLLDLSAAQGDTVSGPIAEFFTPSAQLDLAAAAQSFYRTHEDAYDYLVMFTNFDFDLGGAFAFELNISNQVAGLGRIASRPFFDFSGEFGSTRLQSFVNMGNLQRYPASPSTIFLRGVDNTVSILGQETGHRFLAYALFDDLNGTRDSTALLGRDLQHWSFLFNSDASVVEGNRIRDNGDGTFTTIGAVQHYSDLDQYMMGLRAPDEVSPSFLVDSPSPQINPARVPALNVTFSGKRVEVRVDQIVSANGSRLPNSVIAPKSFNFAFVLVVPKGATPTPEQVAKMDAIRRAWETFYPQATSSRGTASTSLIRGLHLSPNPVGLFPGGQLQGRLELLTPFSGGTVVNLSSSNPAVAGVPARVTIAGGAISGSFPLTAVGPGRALLTASVPGFETSTAVMEVRPSASTANLSLAAVSGDRQTGASGGPLPQPLQVSCAWKPSSS